MSLKTIIARDTNLVFLNEHEFCDNLTLQIGTRKFSIVGSLQQNIVQNNSGTGNVTQRVGYTLYLKYPIDLLEQDNNMGVVLSTGSHITIDNKAYSVVDVSNEMGIATINLSSGAGR